MWFDTTSVETLDISMSRTMNNNSHNNRIEYNVDTINLTSALTGKS